MNCETSIKLMNAFIDGEINAQEQKQLEKHLDSCEKCTLEFEELKAIVETMEALELKPLPIGFEEELHFKLLKANQESQSIKPSLGQRLLAFAKRKSTLAAVGSLAAVAVIVLATQNFPSGLGMKSAKSESEMATSDYLSYDAVESPQIMAPMAPEIGLINTEGSNLTATRVGTEETSGYRNERMVIRHANLRVDVEGYDAVYANLVSWVEASGGYVEHSSTSFKTFYEDRDNLKYGYLTLRVPVEGYQAIIEQIKGIGRVTSEDSSANDITKQYRDTASEIENLKITENRLKEILLKAEEVADVLAIENELTRVRGLINSYGQQLKDWEALVDLTTINVELNEVESLKPVIRPIDNSLMGKAKEGFIETINAIKSAFEVTVIWLIAKSPVLLGIALLAGGVFYWKKKKIS